MIQRLRSAACAVVAAWCAAAAVPSLAQQGMDPERIESTRQTLSQWVETRKIISRERQDWQLGKEILEDRIHLVRGEIDSLEKKIAEADTGLADAEAKRRDLQANKDALEKASTTLEDAIVRLEERTRSLLAWLPEPIQERVEPLTRRIPSEPVETERSLSERYQNVIGILNEINKFNRDVTVTSEVRTLPGGKRAEVETIYLGLGQAYYVTPGKDAAGVGRPSAEGWTWTAADHLAGEIARALAILENEEVPDYVPLPVEIR